MLGRAMPILGRRTLTRAEPSLPACARPSMKVAWCFSATALRPCLRTKYSAEATGQMPGLRAEG
eukprot:2107868-Prymnesium_polylepis.1